MGQDKDAALGICRGIRRILRALVGFATTARRLITTSEAADLSAAATEASLIQQFRDGLQIHRLADRVHEWQKLGLKFRPHPEFEHF